MKTALIILALSAIAFSGCRQPKDKPIYYSMPDYPTLQKQMKEKLGIELKIENLANPNALPQNCAYIQLKCMVGGNFGGYGSYGNCNGFNDLSVADQKSVIEKLASVKKIEVKNPALTYTYNGSVVELALYKPTPYNGNIFVGKKTLSDSRVLAGKKPENKIYFDTIDPSTLKVDVEYQQDNSTTVTYTTADLDAYDAVNSDSDPAFVQALRDGKIEFNEKSTGKGNSCGDSFVVDIKEVFQK